MLCAYFLDFVHSFRNIPIMLKWHAAVCGEDGKKTRVENVRTFLERAKLSMDK